MTTFYAIPAKMMLGIPLVSSLIADASRRYSGMSPYNFLLKTNLRFSDSVLANSRAGLRAYGITDRKARVIYNGADLRRFDIDCDSRSIKKELGISTEFVVIMVASFSTFKDYDLFIDTAKAIGEIRRDVTFLAVGDGPEWKRISKRVTDEKITNVILTGRRKDVESLVSVSDIGLLCTWTEGISNSILEYMALGKPVISTDLRGGSRELIDDGMTGYCTRRDVNSVAGLVNKLLNNSDLRIRMGKRGKDRIWSRFSINRMGKEFQELYTDVLTRKKTPELEKNTAR
jgi:glycosyltransferase involved in cell wall biosynthesis